MVKNLPANAGAVRDSAEFDPWVGKIPWSRAQQPIPVFLPVESHGQRSLVGNSPWGCKESDMIEQLISLFFCSSRSLFYDLVFNIHKPKTLSRKMILIVLYCSFFL